MKYQLDQEIAIAFDS